MRTYADEDHRELARRVRELFDERTRGAPVVDHVYKMIVHDAPQDPVLHVVCWSKRVNLYCLAVQNHNMARCAIESKPVSHSMNMFIDAEGKLLRFAIAKATPAEIEKFNKCWPGRIWR